MNHDPEQDRPVHRSVLSKGDRGSRPYLTPLDVLHEFFDLYSMNEPIAQVQIMADHDGDPRVVVRLGATRLSQIARGMIEWHFTISRTDVTLRRSQDGHTAYLEVIGTDDVGDIPITVVSNPVPCRYFLSVDVDIDMIEPGTEDQINLLALYRWALNYPYNIDNLPHEPADPDTNTDQADEHAGSPA